MFFTQEDYRKIQDWLSRNSSKDSELLEATPLNGNEIISIVQANHNKKISIKDFVNQIFKVGSPDFFNVTDKLEAPYITLEEAISMLPTKAKKQGQVITFLNKEGNWDVYQFIGANNQCNIPDKWNNIFDIDKYIIDSLLPDEEDLTKTEPDEKGNSFLSFKDRLYDASTFSGLGKKVLRKHIIDIEVPEIGTVKKNILYQDIFEDPNTVYEIRYDFDLNGNTIELPENCILDFRGGSITNGTLVLNNTLVLPFGYIENDILKCNVEGAYKEGQMFFNREDGYFLMWDGKEWISASTYFRWGPNNTIQISRNNKDWEDLSEPFSNSLYIKGYVNSTSNLPSGALLGDIYMVGTGAPYDMYVKTSEGWKNNGQYTSITAGIEQTTGQSTTNVMSQKAVTDKFTELEQENLDLSEVINGIETTYTRLATGSVLNLTPILEAGCYIKSIDGISSVSLYDQDENRVYVYADMLPFKIEKTYKTWNAYQSGSPQVTMVVVKSGEIDKLYDAIDVLENNDANHAKEIENIKTSAADISEKVASLESNDTKLSTDIENMKTALTEAKSSIFNVSNEIFIADKMKGTIAELYLVAPKNEDVLLAVKHYNNDLFVRYGTNLINNEVFANDANGWQCRMSLSTLNENEIIPLLCTTASTSLGVAKGDVVGYIIFKDLEKFKSVSSSSVGFVTDDAKCRDIRFSPVIHTELLPKVSILNGVGIHIPSTITAVVGDSLQIFWRSIVSAFNPYVFDVVALGSVGKSYPRYYAFTPTADMAGQSYTIKVCVRGNDGQEIASKDVTINVVAKASNPSAKKKVLCVGASATAGGQWVGELKRRLVETSGNGTAANPTGLGLSNYEFVGRKLGTSNPVALEATGGWTIRSYASAGYMAVRFQVVNVSTLTIGATYKIGSTIYTIQEVNVTDGIGNIRCTVSSYSAPSASGTLTKASGDGDATITYTSYQEENYSPFWNSNEGRIDFQSYATEYCGGSIDVLIWHCGINDLANGGDMELTYSAYRDLLRAYHEQFPSGKVIISSVPIGSVNGGFAANYGANSLMNYWSFTKAVMEYASALMALCSETEFSSYVRYSAAMEQFDAENGYPTSEVAVNNRSSVKEALGTNAVHPITEGSYQIADAVYRTIHNL